MKHKTPKVVVKKGQNWLDRDSRAFGRVVVIDRISRKNGTAIVHTFGTPERQTEIRLENLAKRFRLAAMSLVEAA